MKVIRWVVHTFFNVSNIPEKGRPIPHSALETNALEDAVVLFDQSAKIWLNANRNSKVNW